MSTRRMAGIAILALALAAFPAGAGAGFAPETMLAFDGSHGYVEVDAPEGIGPGSSSFTIEFWANIADDGWDLAFEWPEDDRVYVGHSTGNGWNFVTTTDGERVDTNNDQYIGDILDRWVFVQAVQDRGEDTITLRVYDPQEGAWETASADTPPGETNPTGPLYIPSHPSDYPLKGMLAEVRFWNIPRSQSDAEADMLAGLSGGEKGLAGYWPLNEGEGDVAHDLSANENHGTIHGAEWTPFQPFLGDLPNHKEYAAGETLTLGPVELRDPQGDVTHQWYFNGKPIEGATGSSLTIDEMTEVDLGTYHVRVDDERDLTPFESNRLRLAKPDWPMWRYDAARSADTPHELEEDLCLQWVRELPEPKRAWRHQWDHRGKLDFDLSYAPVVKDRRIFVPSNVTDGVTAYRIEDGAEEWRFYTNGPVRLAPAAWEDKVYFVSDDGYLYCVDAESGKEVWKFQGGPSDHRLLGNERIINFWAARGGPVIKDGNVYFTAGIWPLHGVFIYALDARTGEVEWVNDTTGSDYVQLPHGGATGLGGIAPQGYLAASEDRLVVAGGRTPPAFLDRHTGEMQDVALRAKPEGGYAVHADGQGYMKNEMLADRVEALEGEIGGEVFYKLAAYDRLFVTTTDGTLYCFGPEETEAVHYEYHPEPPRPESADWAKTAQRVLDKLGETEGYALMLGIGSGDLLRELLYRSDLHIVVVEENAEEVRALRDELVETGMYGRRAAVIEAKPGAFSAQPYLFSMVLSEDVAAAGIDADAKVLARLLEGLRPYGGVAYLGISSAEENDVRGTKYAANIDQIPLRDSHPAASRQKQETSLVKAVQTAGVEQLSVVTPGDSAYAAPRDFPRLTPAAGEVRNSRRLSRAVQPVEVDQVSFEMSHRFTGLISPPFDGSRTRQTDSEPRKDFVLAVRGGPLSGAGQWTHQYSDSANTNFSADSRVKAPLGILWFGGPSNENILPRHGHGPVPQVVGGRIILPGPETISARCVYTGREIWEREFPGIGHPFTDQELEERYREGEAVFMHNADGVGANQIGSPYVSLSDGIYVRYKTRVYRLAPDSGEIEAEFQLPIDPEREGKPDWGHLSVWDDLLITTVDPQVFDDEDYVDAFQTMEDIKGRDLDATSSNRLVVMDRHSGEVLWEREARTGFRHNAIVTGGGRLYLIDGLSEEAVQRLQRRGETPDDAVLMALDPHTGEKQWKKDTSIFGTWLGYSEARDVLIQGGRPGGLRNLDDEPGNQVAAYKGATGAVLWETTPGSYYGPLSIRGEEIYLAPSARSGQGWALDLHTGE
ncbi:MAG: PQQ-binding-like beta-propeller repeat protein, partial [Candidatus Hydrogenedentota bacterium]